MCEGVCVCVCECDVVEGKGVVSVKQQSSGSNMCIYITSVSLKCYVAAAKKSLSSKQSLDCSKQA